MKHCIVWKISGYLRKKCVHLFNNSFNLCIKHSKAGSWAAKPYGEDKQGSCFKNLQWGKEWVKACSLILNIQNGKLNNVLRC